MANQSNSAVPRPQTPLEGAINGVRSSIDDLEGSVSTLDERLRNVLRARDQAAAPPSPAGTHEGKASVNSPAVDALDELTQRLAKIAAQVIDITNHVEA